jgi:hypothetical protein
LYLAVTRNDRDVNIEETMALVDALRARKPFLAETRIYDDPPGGHTFDRRVDRTTWQPENTREQRDSWNRVWTFLDWHLDPFRSTAPSPPTVPVPRRSSSTADTRAGRGTSAMPPVSCRKRTRRPRHTRSFMDNR